MRSYCFMQLSFISSMVCKLFYAGGADVLYNKFNVMASRPPVNPPKETNSEYKCVVDVGGYYWRLSQCNDSHHVVCQQPG